MKINEVVQNEAKPMGMLAKFGQSVKAALGSKKAAAKLQTGDAANKLHAAFVNDMHLSGGDLTAVDVKTIVSWLKNKGYEANISAKDPKIALIAPGGKVNLDTKEGIRQFWPIVAQKIFAAQAGINEPEAAGQPAAAGQPTAGGAADQKFQINQKVYWKNKDGKFQQGIVVGPGATPDLVQVKQGNTVFAMQRINLSKEQPSV